MATPRPPKVENEQVDRLLREIAELRLSAATHLTIAAAAMDAGRPDIASELIDAQQRDVADLRRRAAELLAVDGAVADEARRYVLHQAIEEESVLQETAVSAETRSLRSSARRSSVAEAPRQLVRPRSNEPRRWSVTGAVLAVAATVALTLFQPFSPSDRPDPGALQASTAAALDANIVRSYQQLELAAKPSSERRAVEDATRRLHADLQQLVPAAAQDPAAARRLLEVLSAERALLSRHRPEALAAYEAAAESIVAQLRALAVPAVLAILPLPGEAVGDPEQTADALFAGVAAPAQAPALRTLPVNPPSGGGFVASVGGGSGSQGDSAPASGSGSGIGLGVFDTAPLPAVDPKPVVTVPVVPLPLPVPDLPVDPPQLPPPPAETGGDGTTPDGPSDESGAGTAGAQSKSTTENQVGGSEQEQAPTDVQPVLPAPPILLEGLTR